MRPFKIIAWAVVAGLTLAAAYVLYSIPLLAQL